MRGVGELFVTPANYPWEYEDEYQIESDRWEVQKYSGYGHKGRNGEAVATGDELHARAALWLLTLGDKSVDEVRS
jgi:hypothetical protein